MNLVPKTPSTASEQGDLDVDSATSRLVYHDGSAPANVVTNTSTDTLTNKTISNPDITITSTPIKFRETGGGLDEISLVAPASVPSSYTLKLPPDPGTIDYVLRTDGGGATSWVAPTVDVTPSGAIIMWPGAVLPSASWFWCDGAEYDPALQPNLFAVCGFQYNTGGETPGFFRVPRINGRVVAGRDDMGGTPANLLTTVGSGVDGVTLGATGGTQNVTLSTAEIPSHTHTQDPHSHAPGTLANSSSSVSGTVGGSDGTHTHTFTSGTESVSHTHSGTTGTETAAHRHSYGASDTGGGSGGNGTNAATYGDNGSGGSGNMLMLNSNVTGNLGFVASSEESVSHSHPFTSGNASATHTHSGTTDTTGSGHSHGFSLSAAAQLISGSTGSTTATNQNTGGDGAHLNVQPTIILNFIIKA